VVVHVWLLLLYVQDYMHVLLFSAHCSRLLSYASSIQSQRCRQALCCPQSTTFAHRRVPQVVAGEIGTCQISHKMQAQLGITRPSQPEADEWVAEGARPVDAAVEYDLAAPAVAQAAVAAAAGQPPAKKRKK
jgi:hypothetical protein